MTPLRLRVTLGPEDHRWLLEELAAFWVTAHRREWADQELRLPPWPREEYRLTYEVLARRPVPSAERMAELQALFQSGWGDVEGASEQPPEQAPRARRVGSMLEPMRRYQEAEAEMLRQMVEPAVISRPSTFELDPHVHAMLVDWLRGAWEVFERRCACRSAYEVDRPRERDERLMRDTAARLLLLLTGRPAGDAEAGSAPDRNGNTD